MLDLLIILEFNIEPVNHPFCNDFKFLLMSLGPLRRKEVPTFTLEPPTTIKNTTLLQYSISSSVTPAAKDADNTSGNISQRTHPPRRVEGLLPLAPDKAMRRMRQACSGR